jgi:hypothetical protein
MSPSKEPSRSGVGLVNRYIWQRPDEPSVPFVEKLALFVPDPSWASHWYASPPTPSPEKFVVWKFPAASLKPRAMSLSWYQFAR